jgi:hypothetical protein
MDEFFTKKFCDKCGEDLKNGRAMSKFNTDCICMSCSDKEKQDPDYESAVKADNEQIKQGNYNFQGIRAESEKYILSDKVIKQIMVIRAEARFNMFSATDIQREAFEKGFFELAVFIEEHKKEYCCFILTGKR